MPSIETLSATFKALERWEAGTLPTMEWNRKFLPLHFYVQPAPFHKWLCDELDNFHQTRDQKLALIAPRDSAKSTHITFAFILRSALEAREPFILILGETQPFAEQMLQRIRDELLDNDRISDVYGKPFGMKAKSSSTAWARDDQIRLPNGCQIQALGRQSPVRGKITRHNRPTLVVADDTQSNKNIKSDDVRTGTLSWFKQEVVPAGSPGCNFLSVGSSLHRDCLASHLQTLPGWKGKTFKAIITWPDRMDLWDEWQRLASNLADDNRLETSERFLQKHLKEMVRDGWSYWPHKWPVHALMKRRAEIGAAAFATEYQGIPGRLEGSEWPPEYFDWPGFWFEDWPTDLVRKVQSLDPSKGQTDKPGDYQAQIMLGLARNGDLLFDCELRHDPPQEMCIRTCELARAWIRLDKKPIDLVVLEDNGTMGLMEMAIRQATRQTNMVLPWECLTQVDPKPTRIRCVDTYLQTHRIRVKNTPGGRQLVNQWRDWPLGANDDGPDGAATAVRGLEVLQGVTDG